MIHSLIGDILITMLDEQDALQLEKKYLAHSYTRFAFARETRAKYASWMQGF